MEGKYHVANAVSTVISAGLHAHLHGDGSNRRNSNANPILSSPQNTLDEAERIRAAWTVFNLDKAWSVALDSEPNFPIGMGNSNGVDQYINEAVSEPV